MNIDDEIKKLDDQRLDLLEEIKTIKTQVNAIALRMRRLSTIKRHASELVEGTKPATKAEEDEAEFKDPAQIDIELPIMAEAPYTPGKLKPLIVDEVVDADAIEDFLNRD